MKMLPIQVYRFLFLLVGLVCMKVQAQDRTKTYSEEFNVDDDVIVNINTSYTDLEFDTWNKNKVVVEAILVLDGASEEQAEEYFKKNEFEILGNSREISIKNNVGNWEPVNFEFQSNDFVFELPEMPEFESFDFDFDFSELEDLPVMPPVPSPDFDYEAFKEGGEEYMREWQKKFEKSFGEPYQERLKDWQKKMEEKQKQIQKKQKELQEKRQKINVKRMEQVAEARAEHAIAVQERLKERQIHLEERNRNSKNRPHIFYYSNRGKAEDFKVKKVLKIKMPNSAKIKMNVRHGEIKLAERTHNIDALLSYSKLRANEIDGSETVVVASYSPISVENWMYGKLQANYSDQVDLEQVNQLVLDAKSSPIVINSLSDRATIVNDFGPIYINSISENFNQLNVSMRNSNIICTLPQTSFNIKVEGNGVQVNSPADVTMEKIEKGNQIVYNGYKGKAESLKSVHINGRYSEISLE